LFAIRAVPSDRKPEGIRNDSLSRTTESIMS
jgi:hypothetical protein